MVTINFNREWTFWNARTPEEKIKVHLPHDAMQTEKRLSGLKGGTASGFYPGGRYIYEKHFCGGMNWENEHLLLEFDGIYMNSTVSLNGQKIGGRIYGYSHFSVELTDHIKIGEDNILRVEVDNTRTPNSRWYSGSGIYRDVKLMIANPVHIKHEGVRITTKSVNPANIEIETCIQGLDTLDKDGYELCLCIKYLGILSKENEGYRTEEMYRALEAEAPAICSLRLPVTDEKTVILQEMKEAKLWSEEKPELYVLSLQLVHKADNNVVDEQTIHFGIRQLSWRAEQGFCVNGQTVKLRGGCIHHDNGLLGAAEFRKAAFRRIRILKETGFNAIRMSHYPMSKVLLAACDELGMYVYDESFDMWENSKNDYDYSIYFHKEWKNDLTSMVQKDYNHPCVVMYGVGNEVTELTTEKGRLVQKELVDFIHRLDQTRPVTNGCLGSVGFMKATPLGKEKIKNGKSPDDVVNPYLEEASGKARGSLLVNIIVTWMPFIGKLTNRADRTAKNAGVVIDVLDIAGFNYANQMVDELHELRPDKLFLNTETYPRSIGENWRRVMENPAVIGDFMWTAWDYLGETGVGLVEYDKKHGQFNKPYPCVAAGIGCIDMTGHVEAQGEYTKAVWSVTNKPYIGVRPVNHSGENYFMGQWRGTDAVASWSWDGCEGKNAQVEVYSAADTVELFINSRTLGKKKLAFCKATFELPYEKGILKAVAYDSQGKKQGESCLESAGKEIKITVKAEQSQICADGEDLAYVSIMLTDSKGNVKSLADQNLCIGVSGAGVLAGFGSGNPVLTGSFSDPECMTYYGRAMAIIRSSGDTGNIFVTVSGDNLEAVSTTISAGNS